MSRFHPHATTLTLLLMAQENYSADLPHAVHTVIDHAMALAAYPDERKADLFARIAESVGPGMKMLDMQKAIQAALVENERVFYTE